MSLRGVMGQSPHTSGLYSGPSASGRHGIAQEIECSCPPRPRVAIRKFNDRRRYLSNSMPQELSFRSNLTIRLPLQERSEIRFSGIGLVKDGGGIDSVADFKNCQCLHSKLGRSLFKSWGKAEAHQRVVASDLSGCSSLDLATLSSLGISVVYPVDRLGGSAPFQVRCLRLLCLAKTKGLITPKTLSGQCAPPEL